MRSDARWLVVFAGCAVFQLVVSQANHYLSTIPVGPAHHVQAYLFVLGLPVAFAGLRLSLGQGIAATVPTALLVEAGLPLPPGLLTLTSITCLCVTVGVRTSFNRFELSSAVLTATMVNLVLMIVMSAATFSTGVTPGRILADILVSQAVVLVLTGWFFTAQHALVAFFGYDLENEFQEPL